jgi:flagellar motility protein MotE (MotC chaperone)
VLKKLNSPWVGSIMGLIVFMAVTAATWNSATQKIQAAHAAAIAATNQVAKTETPWSFDTAEIDALVKELREERDMLNKREKDLNDLADRLRSERNELTQLTQTVFRMQKEFDQSVSRVSEEETANLKKLAKTYSVMEAEGAAAIFKQMDDASVVKIMVFMKEQETSPIITALSKGGDADAKRAADLTERLRVAVVPKKK